MRAGFLLAARAGRPPRRCQRGVPSCRVACHLRPILFLFPPMTRYRRHSSATQAPLSGIFFLVAAWPLERLLGMETGTSYYTERLRKFPGYGAGGTFIRVLLVTVPRRGVTVLTLHRVTRWLLSGRAGCAPHREFPGQPLTVCFMRDPRYGRDSGSQARGIPRRLGVGAHDCLLEIGKPLALAGSPIYA